MDEKITLSMPELAGLAKAELERMKFVTFPAEKRGEALVIRFGKTFPKRVIKQADGRSVEIPEEKRPIGSVVIPPYLAQHPMETATAELRARCLEAAHAGMSEPKLKDPHV